jgi:hypothetical protein|tara:strand:- start:57 stop:479 length:423 start_codon:yes stop_codon:yes gene_type:complete
MGLSMSAKLMKMQLIAIAAGLAVLALSIPGPGSASTARAAAPSADCLKSVSIQEQVTCNKESQAAKSGFETVAAWIYPSVDEKVTTAKKPGVKAKNEAGAAGGGLLSDDLPATGLMLFGAALVGIAYLGRRRRKAQMQGK